MKQIFLSVVLTTVVMFLKAQTVQPISINAANVEQLTITDDMDVVLVQGHAGESISIDNEAARNVEVRVSNSSMELSFYQTHSKRNHQPVYVYVNGLKKLTVIGNSNIKTMGVLNTAKLDLFVEGNSKIYLATNGMINAFPTGESQIEVRKVRPDAIQKFF